MQQEIILLEDINNLGKLGDVVKVRRGYFRNYLSPRKQAKRVTPATLAEFSLRRAEFEQVQSEKLAGMRVLIEKLEGLTVQIKRKAGVDGRLFGSVTNADIVDALKEQNVPGVEKTAIRMPTGHLKQIGSVQLQVVPYLDMTATITVSILGE